MPAPVSPHADSPTAEVLIALLPDHGDRAADHRSIVALAAQLTPLPETTAVSHRCPSCGSFEHGRPLLVSPDGSTMSGVHVSISRAAGYLALAATLAAPFGIDIESLKAVRTADFDDVAFGREERGALSRLTKARGPAAADRMRALAWSAKEAVLKAMGTGLRTDPREVHLDLDHGEDRIAVREGGCSGAFPLTLWPLGAAGVVGHVAISSQVALDIRWGEAITATSADSSRRPSARR